MSHLAARFRTAELNDQAERSIAQALREANAQALPHPNRHLPGDPWKLRGIPVVGVYGGIGGAIPGTRPESVRL